MYFCVCHAPVRVRSYCPSQSMTSALSCPSGSYGCCGGAATFTYCTSGYCACTHTCTRGAAHVYRPSPFTFSLDCPDTCNIYQCGSGVYCPVRASSPISCPSGRYVDYIFPKSHATPSCLVCLFDSFCAAGSASPSACPAYRWDLCCSRLK